MKKQGFTLIELMVVIVIMGILAAVAVPKLFGMIAKSKASEVGPAAGTYVKLQQAYFSESNLVGTWELIGYKAPGSNTSNSGETTNFLYTSSMTAATNSSLGNGVAWAAKNKVQLNDCASEDNNWVVNPSMTEAGSSSGADISFDALVADGGCEALTPSFETIGD